MNSLRSFSLFFLIASFYSCSTSSFDNIEGKWIASGYNCEDLTGLSETIEIVKNGDELLAIKLTGDKCIPAGDTTWHGSINGDLIIGKIKGMNPQTREIEWHDCKIDEYHGTLFVSVEDYLVLKMMRK